MIARMMIAALTATAIAIAGAGYSAAQDAKTKAPAKTQKKTPKKTKKTEKKSEPKAAKKKETPGTPVLIAQFGDWGVYVNKAAKTCFALSQPKEREPNGVKRNPAYFFVTTRPGDKLSNEVSVMTGFALKEDAAVAVSVGNANFAMYAKNDGVWIKEPAEEAKLVDAMRKGDDLSIKLTPAKGAVTTDTYSLKGVTQALERAAKECS